MISVHREWWRLALLSWSAKCCGTRWCATVWIGAGAAACSARWPYDACSTALSQERHDQRWYDVRCLPRHPPYRTALRLRAPAMRQTGPDSMPLRYLQHARVRRRRFHEPPRLHLRLVASAPFATSDDLHPLHRQSARSNATTCATQHPCYRHTSATACLSVTPSSRERGPVTALTV
jgi:hypothetical protein